MDHLSDGRNPQIADLGNERNIIVPHLVHDHNRVKIGPMIGYKQEPFVRRHFLQTGSDNTDSGDIENKCSKFLADKNSQGAGLFLHLIHIDMQCAEIGN